MYDELVKMLRTCSKRDSCIGWKESCPYLGTGACDNKAEKAADAIEELASKLCDWCGVCPEDKRDLSTCEIYESCRAKPPKEEKI